MVEKFSFFFFLFIQRNFHSVHFINFLFFPLHRIIWLRFDTVLLIKLHSLLLNLSNFFFFFCYCISILFVVVFCVSYKEPMTTTNSQVFIFISNKLTSRRSKPHEHISQQYIDFARVFFFLLLFKISNSYFMLKRWKYFSVKYFHCKYLMRIFRKIRIGRVGNEDDGINEIKLNVISTTFAFSICNWE